MEKRLEKNQIIQEFVKRRNEATWSLDPIKFKKFLEEYVEYYGEGQVDYLCSMSDADLKFIMAKSCLNIIDTPPEVLEKARRIAT